MDFIKDNKYTLLFCLFIIVLAVIGLSITKKQKGIDKGNPDDYLKDYKINEVIPVYITDEELAKKYLSEYVSLLIYYPQKAFALLDDESLNKRFDSYNTFKKYIDNLKTDNFYRIQVKRYSYTPEDGKLSMHVIDADENEFVFRENSLMDYTVIIN